jgi:DNA polymerase
VIVALGKFAAQSLLKTTDPITRLRGREYKFRSAILMPTFHPAYLLRAYTQENRRKVWSDMQAVLAKVTQLRG